MKVNRTVALIELVSDDTNSIQMTISKMWIRLKWGAFPNVIWITDKI